MQNGVTLITRSTTNKVITIMTIAKDFASKLAVAFVAIAMIFMAIAPAVNAADTTEDLQATINDLLAQVAALQAQTNTTTTTTTTTSCDVPMAPLTIGSTGGGVTGLQTRLIADGNTIDNSDTGIYVNKSDDVSLTVGGIRSVNSVPCLTGSVLRYGDSFVRQRAADGTISDGTSENHDGSDNHDSNTNPFGKT